jgi:hypothetical protein
MKITALPSAASARTVRTSSSASRGESTAVGSSRMSTRAPRQSCFTISTRCCAATDSPETGASTSTASPNRCAASVTSRRARAASMTPSARRGSRPSTTFSQTASGPTSMKCWYTTPIPASMAARGSPGGSSRPNARTVPPSAR